MRRSRGFTLTEIVVSSGLMLLAVLGGLSLIAFGLKQFQFAMVDTTLSQRNAQGMRRVVESLRQAMSVSISSDGKTLTYTLPAQAAYADLVTGEVEYLVPLTSDGVSRSFSISDGGLVDEQSDRVLVEGVSATELEPGTSQYGQAYIPFQLTTIGSTRAISIHLVTRETTGGEVRYARMKTTVLLRNLP